MPKAIRFHRTGGPEVFVWEDVPVGDPGPGEVRIRQHAVGLNYLDTYHRSGLYPLALPAVCGSEGAGVVDAVGPGVTDIAPGDRVAYGTPPPGAYAEVRLYPAAQCVKLPADIDFETAAAVMLKGMTVRYLIKCTFEVKPGMTVLWHAAAGGVGLIACQWLAALGVTVIGTVSSEEKAVLARAHGCAHTVIYTRERFVERVRDITGGRGVPVVYDSVGKLTFMDSLDCLQPRGLMVSFGNSSGPVDPFSPAVLAQKGSLFLTRPGLAAYTATRAELDATAADLFEALKSGKVAVDIEQRYALKDAARAHRDLEARKTTGSTVLLV